MRNPDKRYVLRAAGFSALIVMAIAAWNALVDPWSIYHESTLHGFNHFKSADRGVNDRLVKAWQIRREKPEVVLLGSSRVDWGLREAHPALSEGSERVLNAGMAGATMYEVFRMVQHAHAVRPVQTVVIGLDLEMFSQKTHQPTFVESRLRNSRYDRWRGWQDVTATLLSLDALEKSRKTIKFSERNRVWTRADLITRGSRFYEERDEAHYRKSYPFALSQVRRNLGGLDKRQPLLVEQIGYYKQLLEYAYANDIALRMYLHPYHHTALDAIEQGGSTAMFTAWKYQLARVAELTAFEAYAPRYPILDCTGRHAMAMEPLPWPSAHPGPMQWYHESSHFRVKLGDKILDNLFGRASDFGRWLEAE